MKTSEFLWDRSETQSIELPGAVANKLKAEARKSRLTIANIITRWRDDLADNRFTG